VLDGVVLRCAARVVTDRDTEPVGVGRPVLEPVLPCPGACPVGPAGVGQHEQIARLA
jgi:hypothetical protein